VLLEFVGTKESPLPTSRPKKRLTSTCQVKLKKTEKPTRQNSAKTPDGFFQGMLTDPKKQTLTNAVVFRLFGGF
jgi:hypothetical protein